MPNLNHIYAVYLREMLILRHRLGKHLITLCISPLLYVITFGIGIGGGMTVDGLPYITYLIPGIIAMNSMTQAYNISMEINIARFYFKTFDEMLCSPVSALSYTLGEILYGVTRALIATAVTLAIGALFGVFLKMNIWFVLGIVGNSLVFAAIAVIASMKIRHHADQGLITGFVITPMSFLSGTLFPVEKLPAVFQKILLLVPLTHASKVVRAAATGGPVETWRVAMLFGIFLVLLPFAVRAIESGRE